MKQSIVKPERPGGFLDLLPSDYLAREKMLGSIEKVFRSFGFDPIETPRVEFLKTLAGETSDTGKNIFHIKTTTGDEPLALPFDHTVPFARILAANPYNAREKSGIRLPWRRAVVGPVFRADTPQSGRYRQFYQFDADIAGTASMLADAEIIAIIYYSMIELGVENFKIKVNNRKILNGLAVLAGISEREKIGAADITKEMMRILDKLDKIGVDEVIKELRAASESEFDPRPNLSSDATEKIVQFLKLAGDNKTKINSCKDLFKSVDIAEEGLEELSQILSHVLIHRVPEEFVEVDFSIARGLDYYTGPVMETVLTDAPEFGSIFSGGRYNNLVAKFTGKKLPAVGASIGVDRLFAALSYLKKIDRSNLTVSHVMVLRLSKNRDHQYLEIVEMIREAGLNAELSLLESTTFHDQFNYALTRGVKHVVIVGDDEFSKNAIQIKDLVLREQKEIPKDQFKNYLISTFNS